MTSKTQNISYDILIYWAPGWKQIQHSKFKNIKDLFLINIILFYAYGIK